MWIVILDLNFVSDLIGSHFTKPRIRVHVTTLVLIFKQILLQVN
jgi:hypothetical protein